VKQDTFNRARPLWDAVDVGLTARELKHVRRMGGNPDLTYRRRFTCPLCSKPGATETLRGDLYIFDLRKPQSLLTPMSIQHAPCKLDLHGEIDDLLQFMSFACENFQTLKGKPITVQRIAGMLLSKFFSPGTKHWPWERMTIQQVVWKRALSWRRIEHGIPGSSAVYRTLAQAAAATPSQHNEVVAAQLYRTAPRRIKLLKTLSCTNLTEAGKRQET
jgi:hypothetical protein